MELAVDSLTVKAGGAIEARVPRGFHAGRITVTAESEIAVESGGLVKAKGTNLKDPQATVELRAGGDITIDGTVVALHQTAEGIGGVVTIESQRGRVVVSGSGEVLANGRDPGRCRIALEACLGIVVDGVIDGTCKQRSSRVTLLSHETITVTGEVRANLKIGVSNPGDRQVLVLKARSDIVIAGGLLSANAGATNKKAGTVRVLSSEGSVELDPASVITARAIGGGSAGGSVLITGFETVTYDGTIKALGNLVSGKGGTIVLKSLQGDVAGEGVLDNRAASPGTCILEACGGPSDGGSFLGSCAPAPTQIDECVIEPVEPIEPCPAKGCAAASPPVCGGSCPAGGICAPEDGACRCVVPSCELTLPPQCGGRCPPGQVCAQFDGLGCRCVLPPCALEVAKTCVVLQPPATGVCRGGTVSLTFEYTGESCSATTNDQGGKAECEGDPAGAEPVRVMIVKDPHRVKVSPGDQVIAIGDRMVIEKTAGSKKLPADIALEIRQDSLLLQSLTIHTSCSRPLAVGDQFGSLRLVSMTSRRGGTVTLPPPPEPSPVCEVVTPPPPHCDGKLRLLMLRYQGGDCTIAPNDQSGKAACAGDAGSAEPVKILITRDAGKLSVDPSGQSIHIGDVFAISSVEGKLPATTEFDIVQDSTVLQSLSIHTSCSQPLDLGNRFGSVEVVGLDTTGGGQVALGASVEYRYEIANSGPVEVTEVAVVDDVLGVVPGSPIASIASGESVTLTAEAFVEQDTTNLVTVTGVAGAGVCQAEASAAVTFVRPPPADRGEGCTPGYWKQTQHFDSWVVYLPGDSFEDVFGVGAPFGARTLLEVLKQRGGGANAFGRQAVAALLNATHPSLDYPLDKAEVIAIVQAAFAGGDFEEAKEELEQHNESGCPLD